MDARCGTWLAEIVRTLPGLVDSYRARGVIDPRAREDIVLAVTDANGCRSCAWVHGSWRGFLGDIAGADASGPMLAYARSCAERGRPASTADLAAALPPGSVRAVRATVAHGELANVVGRAVDELGDLIAARRARRPSPLALARDAVTVAAAAPFALPFVAAAGAMRLATRLAPALPAIEVPPAGEANLLAGLLATAVPAYLANAATRLVVFTLPGPIAFGVRAGRSAATVRLARDAIVIENGISSDAMVVVEGDVEALYEAAARSIVRDVHAGTASRSASE